MKSLSLIALGFAVAATSYGGTISTPFASNTGGVGNFFDGTSLIASPVTVLGTFRVDANTTGTETFSVYYRPGTYAGFQASSAGWTLLGTSTAVGQAPDTPTPINVGNSFVIGPGLTFGLYIVGDGKGLLYTDGNTTVSDANLKLTLGSGSGNPAFASNFSLGRIWNGQLDYSLGGAAAAPEPAGIGLASLSLGLLLVLRRSRKR